MTDIDGAVGVAKAAEMYDVSVDAIRAAYRSGALTVRYYGPKVLIGRADLKSWFDSLPTERRVAS